MEKNKSNKSVIRQKSISFSSTKSDTSAKFKKGDQVVKVIVIMGTKTGAYAWVVGKNKNKGYISIADTKNGEPYGHYDIHAYHEQTGKAFENVIPGCSSYLLTIDEAKSAKIKME